MKFSITAITALLAASVIAAPTPAASPNPSAVLERAAEESAIEKRGCVFNASIKSSWGESGMTRYRTDFSTTKPGVDMCKVMNAAMASTGNCGGIQNNYACYYNNVDRSWVVDVNEVVGPAGWNAIQCEIHNAINWACNDLGCGTG